MNLVFTASIICMDHLNLEKEIQLLLDNGIKNLHADFMDGVFVPRLGMYPEQIKNIKEKFPEVIIDSHLLIDNPNQFIDQIIEYSDIVIVHAENHKNLYGSISKIKSKGKKVGVGLNIATSVESIKDIVKDIDMIMLMGFNPGILNQSLWEGLYKKILDIREEYPYIDIMIDGGVKLETSKDLVRCGANYLVCGSSTIYKQEGTKINVKSNIEKLKQVFND